MPVKINSFGGPLVWGLRKIGSRYTTAISYKIVENYRKKKTDNYIGKFFSGNGDIPVFKFLMLETVNRCNGKCDFCPANALFDKRKYQMMPMETVEHILDDLVRIGWKGTIFPQVNNEPFIDKRIIDIIRMCKDKLPESKIYIITNGTLLTKEILDQIREYVDVIVINDYSASYRLSPNVLDVYKYVKKRKLEYKSIDITIARRYTKEILSTRAGNAPNKPKKTININKPCIYPFTDMIVFPTGNVGLCCNDCNEITKMGNVFEKSLIDIWNDTPFTNVRKKMRSGRMNYSFCKECDVVDAGSREKVI